METEKKFCSKIVYTDTNPEGSPTILLGVILEDKDGFLKFRTARRVYIIRKSLICSIEETDEEFMELALQERKKEDADEHISSSEEKHPRRV